MPCLTGGLRVKGGCFFFLSNRNVNLVTSSTVQFIGYDLYCTDEATTHSDIWTDACQT